MTCPSVLKRKLSIEPISPGRIQAIFDPIALSPFPRALLVAFRALVRASMTALLLRLAARRIAVRVTPFFWKSLWFFTDWHVFVKLSRNLSDVVFTLSHSFFYLSYFIRRGISIVDNLPVLFIFFFQRLCVFVVLFIHFPEENGLCQASLQILFLQQLLVHNFD